MESNLITPVTNQIDIFLTTTSPWHVAFPGNAETNPATGKNVASTLKKKMGRSRVPYFTANGVRGALRRHARDILLPYITQTSGPVSTDLFNGLSCGASTGSPDSSPNSVEELARGSEHIYMGLFGGGARLLAGRLQVSDINIVCEESLSRRIVAISREQAEIVKALHPSHFGESPTQPYQFVDERHIIRRDDIVQALTTADLASIAGGAEAIAEHYNAVGANTADRKAAKKAGGDKVKKSTLSNLITLEAIPEGVPMHLRVSLAPDTNEAQLGLILICLQSLFRRNYFGGYGRTGFGMARVDGIYVGAQNLDINLSEPGDALYDDKGHFLLSSKFDALAESAAAAMASLDRDELESYFLPIAAQKKAS